MSGLRDELHSLEEGVRMPLTQAAEGAWSTARRRVRRRRAAAVGGVAAAVVAAAVGLQALTGGPSEVEPAPLPPTRDSLLDVASEPVAGERLDALLSQTMPERVEDREVVPLADDPLSGPAVYAVGVGRRGVQVLGADGRYRSIPDLEVIANGVSLGTRPYGARPDAGWLGLFVRRAEADFAGLTVTHRRDASGPRPWYGRGRP